MNKAIRLVWNHNWHTLVVVDLIPAANPFYCTGQLLQGF